MKENSTRGYKLRKYGMPKVGWLSSITKHWTCSSPSNVRSYDVPICLVGNLANLVFKMFHVRSFEAKNKLLEFDHQNMNRFESFVCSDNDVQPITKSHHTNANSRLLTYCMTFLAPIATSKCLPLIWPFIWTLWAASI